DAAFETLTRQRVAVLPSRGKDSSGLSARSHSETGSASWDSGDLRMARICVGWRLNELRHALDRIAPPGWRICRQNFELCATSRGTWDRTNDLRPHYQSQNRQGAWAQHSPLHHGPRRRGDRMTKLADPQRDIHCLHARYGASRRFETTPS